MAAAVVTNMPWVLVLIIAVAVSVANAVSVINAVPVHITYRYCRLCCIEASVLHIQHRIMLLHVDDTAMGCCSTRQE